jgi:undecaprenyl-diphosphatase
MPILHAIVLGITQGLSEFLPISSSGHLRMVPWLFGWHDFAAHSGAHGGADLEKTFDVALHLGTLIALLGYFWSEIWKLLKAGLRRGAMATHDGRLGWLLVASSIPAALVGAVFNDVIERNTGQIPLIAAMLVLFGLVLGWADTKPGGRSIDQVTTRDAIYMGVGQALSLQPGVSRSGVTMTAGRLAGRDRAGAVRFAFLMSIPITAGALVFKGLSVAKDGIPHDFVAPFAWGIVTSGVVGLAAVAGTLRIVRSTSFRPFVIYRVAAGALVLFVYYAIGR